MSSLELVRWALYADLGVLFGVPAAALSVVWLPVEQAVVTASRAAAPIAVAAFRQPGCQSFDRAIEQQRQIRRQAFGSKPVEPD